MFSRDATFRCSTVHACRDTLAWAREAGCLSVVDLPHVKKRWKGLKRAWELTSSKLNVHRHAHTSDIRKPTIASQSIENRPRTIHTFIHDKERKCCFNLLQSLRKQAKYLWKRLGGDYERYGNYRSEIPVHFQSTNHGHNKTVWHPCCIMPSCTKQTYNRSCLGNRRWFPKSSNASFVISKSWETWSWGCGLDITVNGCGKASLYTSAWLKKRGQVNAALATMIPRQNDTKLIHALAKPRQN